MKKVLLFRIVLTAALISAAWLGSGCATTVRQRHWVGVPYVLGCRVTDYSEKSVVDRVCVGVPVYWIADQ